MAAKRDPRKLRKIATDFWFAVQRMGRGPDDAPGEVLRFYPPPDDDPDGDVDESRVPRHGAPSSGSAGAAVPEPRNDEST